MQLTELMMISQNRMSGWFGLYILQHSFAKVIDTKGEKQSCYQLFH